MDIVEHYRLVLLYNRGLFFNIGDKELIFTNLVTNVIITLFYIVSHTQGATT